MYKNIVVPGGTGQWIVGLTLAFCGFTGGMCLVWAASVFPKVEFREVHFNLSHVDKSNLASFLNFGEVVATIPTSFMQNALGRRRVLLICIQFLLLAWPLIYFVQYVWAILLARSLMGLWIGFYLTCCPAYISEISTSWARGRIIGQLMVMTLSGCLLQSILGIYLSYQNVALMAYTITFILYVVLLNTPESVYSLVKKKKLELAESNLKWLRGTEDVSVELARIDHYLEKQMARKNDFMEIFRWPASRMAFKQSLCLALVQRFNSFPALSSYASVILPDSWILSENYPVLWTGIHLLFLSISICFVDHVDRKILLFISTLGSALFAMLVALWYYLYEQTSMDMSKTLWMPLVGVSLQGAFYAFGLLYIPMIFQGEVFPMNIKAKAGSLIGFLGFFSEAIIVQIFIPLQEHGGVCSNFLIYSFVSLIGCFLSTKIVETRNTTLEHIQRVLEGREADPLSFLDK